MQLYQTKYCLKWLCVAFTALFVSALPEAVFAQTTIPLPQSKPQQSPAKPVLAAKQPAAIPSPTETARIYQTACLPLITKQIDGMMIEPIQQDQCEVKSPLQLTAINKPVLMRFDQPVTTNCSMAVALSVWANDANALAQKHFGSPIKTIGTGSHYQCRKVNNGSKGRVSEHAFGNALDVMSFSLQNGQVTQLEPDWKKPGKSQQFWRELHAKSCAIFMTVLGPEADSEHANNLHLDMGCHGASCTYRICQ